VPSTSGMWNGMWSGASVLSRWHAAHERR
jgi:hypothetical protein